MVKRGYGQYSGSKTTKYNTPTNKYSKLAKGIKFGIRNYPKIKAGVRSLTAAFRRVAGNKSRVATTQKSLSGISTHNDWAALPSKVILTTTSKHPKTVGTYKLTHQMDYVFETTVTGTQTVGYGSGILTQPQMIGTTSTSSNWWYSWGTDPFLLNPYSTPVTNSIYTLTPVPAVAAGDKISIQSCHSTFDFLSLANIAQKVEVYFLLCNANSSVDPLTQWQLVEQALGYMQLNSSIGPTTTAVEGTIGYGTRANANTPLPKGFGKFWKTIHKDQFMLQPGDSLRMVRTMHFNRVITKNWLTANNSRYLKGISIFPLVVVNGALVGIAPPGETTYPVTNIDRVSQGRTKIGILQKDDYVFGALPPSRFDVNRLEIGNVQSQTVITETIDVTDETQQATTLG